jgi:magnesium transporter
MPDINATGVKPPKLPRAKDGAIRKAFVKSATRGIEAVDVPALRAAVDALHESDLGALLEALASDLRPRLVEPLGIDYDFTAFAEAGDAVRSAAFWSRSRFTGLTSIPRWPRARS